VTFSVHNEPFNAFWIAIWVMAVVRVAASQCFSPGGHQIRSRDANLREMSAEERHELVERDQVDPIVQVDVSSPGTM
jgi:hypothetical protein